MLGEGLRAGLAHLGIPLRTVCYVEREAYAAAVLAARCEERSLDCAPVWSDLLTFDAGRWAGAVDGIVAGFPCQDLSLAGRRAGLDGKRSGLFFDILDIAERSGAWFLFLENVAGIASATASVVDEAEGDLEERAAARVVGELADRGWNAEWLTLSASDVGASHGRERWFCFAWRQPVDDAGCVQRCAGHEQDRPSSAEASGHETHDGPADRGELLDDTECAERREAFATGIGRRQGNDRGRPEKNGRAGKSNEVLGHPESQRRGEARQCDVAPWSAGTGGPGAELANTTQHGRREGRTEPAGQQGRPDAAERCGSMADACGPGRQGSELGRALHGNWGGRKHMDQLSNFVAHSSHLAQPISDGLDFSESSHGSHQPSASKSNTTPRLLSRRLNPMFGEHLMGWPLDWTSTHVPSASSASETALWRLALAWQLSCCFGEQASPVEWREAA